MEDIKQHWPIAIALLALIVLSCAIKGDAYQLWSGFIGALLGAWATLQSSKSTIRETESLERALRKEEEHTRAQSLFEALRAEVEFNLKTIKTHGDTKLVSFSSSSWEAFRPFLRHLDEEVKEPLFTGYCAASAHQNALALELTRGSAGPNVLANNVNEARVNFEKALGIKVWVLVRGK